MAATTEYPQVVEQTPVPTFFVTSIELNTVECCTHVTLFCETPTEGRREQRTSVRLIIPTHLLPVMVGRAVSHMHEVTAAAGRATTN
jgi:hypothetical protein